VVEETPRIDIISGITPNSVSNMFSLSKVLLGWLESFHWERRIEIEKAAKRKR
jgi:hypothetical protein